MRRIGILCLTLGFALSCTMTVTGQNLSLLASKIAGALKAKKPGWSFIPIVESDRLPLVPSEKKILVGFWAQHTRRVQMSEGMFIHIYEVENPTEARLWLKQCCREPGADGWKTSIYTIGDEGCLSNYREGKQCELHFRIGNFVGRISGFGLGKVKDTAQQIVAQIPSRADHEK
jgi:hypothetical protein